MDKREWNISVDPWEMLKCIRTTSAAVDRKFKLFALACAIDEGPGKAEDWQKWAEAKVQDAEHFTPVAGAMFWCGVRTSHALVMDVTLQKKARRAEILRCVFCNPFDTVSIATETSNFEVTHPDKRIQMSGIKICKPLLVWNDGTIPKMANAIYEAEDWGAMPILADACEEAGCTDNRILDHLRQTTCPHCRAGNEDDLLYSMDECPFCKSTGKPVRVRGDWVIDLLAGKDQ